MGIQVRHSKLSTLVSAFVFTLLVVSALAFVPKSLAQSSIESQSPLMTPDELKVLDRARKKAYLGGRDEESLKVQAQLPVPSRKMSPATDAPADSGAAAPAASDD